MVRRVLRFCGKGVLRLLRLLVLTGLVLLILLGVLTQTGWGRDKILWEALARVEGLFKGQLDVEGVSSPGLLRGFTFRGIRLVAEDGGTFLQADSLRAGISLPSLLTGDVVVTSVEVWRPEVTLERLPGQEEMNVARIFAREGQGESASPRRSVALRGVRIHDGELHIRVPLGEAPAEGDRFLVETAPDGRSLLRRMSFRNLELRLSEALLVSPQLEGQRFGVEELSFLGEVWKEPFQVEGLMGQLRLQGSRLLATLAAVRLPSSSAQGRVEVDWGRAGEIRVSVQGDAAPLSLEDLHFLEARLPPGEARGPFTLEIREEGVILGFSDTELTLGPGRLRARGGLLLGRRIGFRDLALDLDEVDLGVLDPWLRAPLPLRGSVTGSLGLGGGLDALRVQGALTFADSGASRVTEADFSGVLHLGETFGVTEAQVTLAPFEWGTLAGVFPAIRLRGPGAVRMEAAGDLQDGIRLSMELTHVPSAAPPSRITAEGTLRTRDRELVLDLEGELHPLSFTSLRVDYPTLPLTGDVSGPVSVRGPLSDLSLEARLATSAGPMELKAHFDARNPGGHYALDGEVRDFLLSGLVPDLPHPSRVSGRLMVRGRGLSPDSMSGEAEAFLSQGEIGRLQVDTAALVLRVEGGLLLLDALMAETDLGRLSAGGSFGLSSEAPPGELNVQFRSESLAALRPFLMEEPGVVYESLSDFERQLLVLEGVNLDTLPRAAEVAVEGRAQGRATFRGGIRDFSGEGSLAFQAVRFRTDFMESGTLTFSARGLPGEEGRVEAILRTDSLSLHRLSFQEGEAEVDVGRWGGRVALSVRRSQEEEYRAQGTFVLEPQGGGVIHLDQLMLRFDTARWNLGGPTSVAWSPDGYRVRDFRLIQPGVGSMRISANGFLPLRGEGDFDLEVHRLDLGRLARVAQMEEALEGVVDLDLRVTGTPQAPLVAAELSGEGLRRGEWALDSLTSTLEYRDRHITGEVSAGNRGDRVLWASGSFPADLRVRPEGPRIPEEPVDLRVAMDLFPASIALAFLEALEEVKGIVSGEVQLSGTPRHLAPDGVLRLTGGSALLPSLGVRYSGVEVALGLRPDGTVEVEGSLASRGTARVTGTVTLDPITDPGLDLRIQARDFLAVNRRDVQARLSGQLHILKSYRRPRVEGALTVEQGVLMVEEMARSALVVDLSDPAFFNVVDTTLVSLRPVLRTLQASQNPFLQNLQLNLQMAMTRDSWLRGRDMNLEMGGELSVFWDRTARDLALVGDLNAIRGVYSVLGRQFQVQEGKVSFQGTPGINPDLSITAQNRLRTADGERLDIIAKVDGSLLSPRVSLSSNAPFPIAESDLVSYLIFGRPSYALASGQSTFVKGAAGSLLGAATGATANLAVGLFSSELGSVFTRDAGLDFLAISQGQDAAPLGTLDLPGTVATTQVEIGQYLTQDIFAALLWRPLTGLGGTSQSQFAGLRVEWRLGDLWTLEAFIEDRFARSPLFRFGEVGSADKVKGFFLFREWGY